MSRLVEILAATRHRFVVSMGPQHRELELAPNMDGAEFLPQPSILRLIFGIGVLTALASGGPFDGARSSSGMDERIGGRRVGA